eukprot:4465092-Pyramimonas_sp.AAC.1
MTTTGIRRGTSSTRLDPVARWVWQGDVLIVTAGVVQKTNAPLTPLRASQRRFAPLSATSRHSAIEWRRAALCGAEWRRVALSGAEWRRVALSGGVVRRR